MLPSFHPAFAYLGPDSVLPVTSVLVTIAAVFAMLGKNSLRFALGRLRSSWSPKAQRRQAPPAHQLSRRYLQYLIGPTQLGDPAQESEPEVLD